MRKIRFWLTIAALLLVLTGCEFSYEGVDYTSEIMETISPVEEAESGELETEATEIPTFVVENETVETTEQQDPDINKLIHLNSDYENIFLDLYDNDTAAEIYRSVLINEKRFFCEIDREMKSVNLREFHLYAFHGDVKEDDPIKFAVVDLDGDNIPEIVVDFYEFVELVLHYEDDNVYGYEFSYRTLGGIVKDGSFRASGGGGFHVYEKLYFFEGTCDTIGLASYNYDLSHNPSDPHFYINSIEVTQEEAEIYEAAQDEKEEVEWYPLMEITH